MASDFSVAMLNARGRRAIVASLQDDLQWSLTPGIYTSCSPLPRFNRVGPFDQQRILQRWWYLTSKIRYKRHCSFCAGCTATLLGHSFWSKLTIMQGPRHWGTIWSLLPPGRKQPLNNNHEWTILEADLWGPINPWDDYSPTLQLEWVITRYPEPKPYSQASPRFLTLRNCVW